MLHPPKRGRLPGPFFILFVSLTALPFGFLDGIPFVRRLARLPGEILGELWLSLCDDLLLHDHIQK